MFGIEEIVVVEEGDEGVRRRAHACVSCLGATARAFMLEERDAFYVRLRAAVVDDHDLARIARGAHGVDRLADQRRAVLRPDDDADRNRGARDLDLGRRAAAPSQLAERDRAQAGQVDHVKSLGELHRGRESHRAVRVESTREGDVVTDRELRVVLGDGRVLVIGDGRDVDDRVRAQRLADFVERHTRDREIGEESRVVLHELAEDARERDVIGMNFDGTRDEDQVGTERRQLIADRPRCLVAESAVGKAQELQLGGAEPRETAPRFFFAKRRIASLRRAVRGDDDSHRAPLAQMQRNQSAAGDDFVIGMGCEDKQPLTAEQRRFVRNRLRLNHISDSIGARAS